MRFPQLRYYILLPPLILLVATVNPSVAYGFTLQQNTGASKIKILKPVLPQDRKLPFGGKLTIEVEVFDKVGNKLAAVPVKWQLASETDEPFVYIGKVVNGATMNSVELIWRPGPPGAKAPSKIQVVARADEAMTIESFNYDSPDSVDAIIMFSKEAIEIQPGGMDTVKLTARAKEDERILKDAQFTTELADPALSNLVKVIGPDKDNVITIVGLYGDPSKPVPFKDSALVVHTQHATKTLPLKYVGEPVKTVWEVLPSEIVGDNYGRAITRNYFCAEVTIQNYSGADIALAGLVFDRVVNDVHVYDPVSSYSTVRGTLAKRKLTHPRTLTLAVVDAVGSLMTGFNPYFHNDAHKANYSTFIDVISNPLAKGLSLVWKDSYPDEVNRFESDVLKDDKNIANGTTFKTKIFFPKRLLFTDKDPKRNDPAEVRKALGQLIVLGYKFQRGSLTEMSRTR